MEQNLTLIDCQTLLMALIVVSDRELTQKEVGTASWVLQNAFGVSEDRGLFLLETATKLLETMEPGDGDGLIAQAMTLIRTEMTIEQRTGLYVQLEMIARSDGLDSMEENILATIRTHWNLPENSFEEVNKKAQQALARRSDSK